MPRYAMQIEYNGAPFAGWQRQQDQPSVQGALEAALAALEPDLPSMAAAGRTDAGVHARGENRKQPSLETQTKINGLLIASYTHSTLNRDINFI